MTAYDEAYRHAIDADTDTVKAWKAAWKAAAAWVSAARRLPVGTVGKEEAKEEAKEAEEKAERKATEAERKEKEAEAEAKDARELSTLAKQVQENTRRVENHDVVVKSIAHLRLVENENSGLSLRTGDDLENAMTLNGADPFWLDFEPERELARHLVEPVRAILKHLGETEEDLQLAHMILMPLLCVDNDTGAKMLGEMVTGPDGVAQTLKAGSGFDINAKDDRGGHGGDLAHRVYNAALKVPHFLRVFDTHRSQALGKLKPDEMCMPSGHGVVSAVACVGTNELKTDKNLNVSASTRQVFKQAVQMFRSRPDAPATFAALSSVTNNVLIRFDKGQNGAFPSATFTTEVKLSHDHDDEVLVVGLSKLRAFYRKMAATKPTAVPTFANFLDLPGVSGGEVTRLLSHTGAVCRVFSVDYALGDQSLTEIDWSSIPSEGLNGGVLKVSTGEGIDNMIVHESRVLRVLAGLENIPYVVSGGEIGGRQAILLAPVGEHLRSGRALPENIVKDWFDALTKVHSKSYAHRDVHKRNLLVRFDESGGSHGLLIDFGAAREIRVAVPFAGSVSTASDAVLKQIIEDPFKVVVTAEDEMISLVRAISGLVVGDSVPLPDIRSDSDPVARTQAKATAAREYWESMAEFRPLKDNLVEWDNFRRTVASYLEPTQSFTSASEKSMSPAKNDNPEQGDSSTYHSSHQTSTQASIPFSPSKRGQ